MTSQHFLSYSSLLICVLVCVLCPCRARERRKSDQPLTIHILPHSHCDAAYKKTVDEYYQTEVRHILDSVVDALEFDRNRRFVWSEVIFLTKWWQDRRTTSTQRQAFQRLLGGDGNDDDGSSTRQLELVGGGWVMHDEAIVRYDSMIHQMTYGHGMLANLFPNITNISTGYQIDPFGPSLFNAAMTTWSGMNMLIHNRIPYKEDLAKNQSLQFYWEIPSNERIWVHIYDEHYASQDEGFDWESFEARTESVNKTNVQYYSDKFVATMQNKTAFYRTPHLLFPFGGDFRFQNASVEFENMDQIMRFVKSNPARYPGVSIKYSTPQEYRQAVFESIPDGQVDQFFPVIQGSPFLPQVSGYYTQIPVVKQMLRGCEMILRAVESQLVFMFPRVSEEMWNRLRFARETVYVMQHHDAITATSYRFVLHDYVRRMRRAFEAMPGSLSRELQALPTSGFIVGGGPYIHETVLVRGVEDARSIQLERVVAPQMGMDDVYLQVVNSLGWMVDTVVSFVCSRSDVAVVMRSSKHGTTAITSQATPLETELETENLGLFLVSFRAVIGALSSESYSVSVCDTTSDTFQEPKPIPGLLCATVASPLFEDDIMTNGIGTKLIHLEFDNKTRDISSMSLILDSGNTISTQLSHDIILYDGSMDNIYDIRTAVESSNPPPLLGTTPRKIVGAFEGPIFAQVTIEYLPWFKTRYRIHRSSILKEVLQVSVMVGPMPLTLPVNVASRLSTGMLNTSWAVQENGYYQTHPLYSDDRGVGRNIHPMVSSACIQETGEGPKRKLIAYTGDPRGVVSRINSSLDLFWHRWNNDTSDEWLKQGVDRSTIRSSIWLRLESSDNTPFLSRGDKFEKIVANDVVAFAATKPVKFHCSRSEMKTHEIPDNLHLVSFRISHSTPPINGTFSKTASWVDLQVENLSSDPSSPNEVYLAALLPEDTLSLENALLESLTFAHAFVGQGCQLKRSQTRQGTILTVDVRRICSVRIPVKLGNAEAGSRR
jgi:hypothetical protein